MVIRTVVLCCVAAAVAFGRAPDALLARSLVKSWKLLRLVRALLSFPGRWSTDVSGSASVHEVQSETVIFHFLRQRRL